MVGAEPSRIHLPNLIVSFVYKIYAAIINHNGGLHFTCESINNNVGLMNAAIGQV